MKITLLTTSKPRGVNKSAAGRFGEIPFVGKSKKTEKVCRSLWPASPPVPLFFAYLAAIFKQRGWEFDYAVDKLSKAGDVVLLHPALATIEEELELIRTTIRQFPAMRVLVAGPVATDYPELFAGLAVTLLTGEVEALHWSFDEVFSSREPLFSLGQVEDLDSLPFPDWEPFPFSRADYFPHLAATPVGLVEMSRGCPLYTGYSTENREDHSLRLRSPFSVAQEIRHGIRCHNFRSFHFCDSIFGLSDAHVWQLLEELQGTPEAIEFSVTSHSSLLAPDLLEALSRAGLRSIRLGYERSDLALVSGESTPRGATPPEVMQRFVKTAAEVGVATVVDFMLGFPEENEVTLRRVLAEAQALNPTFAYFHLFTSDASTPLGGGARLGLTAVGLSHENLTDLLDLAYLTFYADKKKSLRKPRAGWFSNRKSKKRVCDAPATRQPTLRAEASPVPVSDAPARRGICASDLLTPRDEKKKSGIDLFSEKNKEFNPLTSNLPGQQEGKDEEIA